MAIDDEKTYEGEVPLRYVFKRNEESKYLFVGFSGFSKPNEPAAYHMIWALRNVDHNKLFILDNYGVPSAVGTFYLGLNGDLQIARSVIGLIDEICSTEGIPRERVIACGTSKGGFAALYFAFRYGLGAVIAGSPPVLLGNYLFSHWIRMDIAAFITGGKNQGELDMLNSHMGNAIAECSRPPLVFLQVGRGEYYYWNHIIPLEQMLRVKGFSYELELVDCEKHSDLGKFFTVFLDDKIARITSSTFSSSLPPAEE